MKKSTKLSLLIVAVILSFSLIGCESTLGGGYRTYNVNGDVVNAKLDGNETNYWTIDGSTSGDTLTNAAVRLFKVDGDYTVSSSASYTSSVNSSGEFYFSEIQTGKYKLTGSKFDWTFVPLYVDVSGDNVTLPTLIAYPKEADSTTVTILVAWENINYDVDLHAAIGDPVEEVYYNNPSSSFNGHVNLDRDVTSPYNDAQTSAAIPRVETITVSGKPDNIYTEDDTPDDADTVRFFVNSYGRFYPNGSLPSALTGYEDNDIPSAWATVYAMVGNTHYGTWTLPYNTAEDTLKVITMHFYDSTSSAYQIFTAGSEYDTSGGANSDTMIKSFSEPAVGGTIGIAVDEIK